ncbi:MAG: hypothetical protein ACRD3H_13230 [Terriglobales bacterium]
MPNALAVWIRYLNATGVTEKPVLFRENEWVRVYRTSSGLEFKESKFLTGEANWTADWLKQKWITLSTEDKAELVQAFVVRSNLSAEDQKIIDYLLQVADDQIAIIVAHILPKFDDRGKAMEFIKERIVDKLDAPLASYFDALARMKDPGLLAILINKFQQYRNAGESISKNGQLNFLYCCYSLWEIVNDPVYQDAIREFAESEDEGLRLTAQRMLEGRI